MCTKCGALSLGVHNTCKYDSKCKEGGKRGKTEMVMVKGEACASSRDHRKQDMFSQGQMVEYGWGAECAVGYGERQSLRKGPTLS